MPLFLALSLRGPGRHGDRQRPAALAGQAALPRPDRAGSPRSTRPRSRSGSPPPRRPSPCRWPRRRRLADGPRRVGGWWRVIAPVPWLGLVAPRPATRGGTSVAGSRSPGRRTRLGWRWRASSGSSRCRRTRSSAGSPQCSATPASRRSTAGLLLGLVAGVSIPLSLVVPRCAGRAGDPAGWCWRADGAATRSATSGWCSRRRRWRRLVGAPRRRRPPAPSRSILTLVGLRARTPEGTAALSAFTQSAGYLLAAAGPFAIGMLHDATGGWTGPSPCCWCWPAAGRPGGVRRAAAGRRGPARPPPGGRGHVVG